MLCTDDSHIEDIAKEGHIDKIIKLGLELGIDIIDLIRAASINPIKHYNLPVGMLRVGDAADFIIVENLKKFNVLKSFINGQIIYEANKANKKNKVFSFSSRRIKDKFTCLNDIVNISEEDIRVIMPQNKNSVKVIKAEDGSLITKTFIWQPVLKEDRIINTDIEADILKVVVINRYQKTQPAIGFIKNFGLKNGAIASSVAHDSHNIVAVGVDDKSIVEAVNQISSHGGISVVAGEYSKSISLNIAGLMSDNDAETLLNELNRFFPDVDKTQTTLKSPFMTLSFMSLLVIPELKISDKGLFDANKFELTDLFDF
jgi:adenine deaminase